jgi:branched-chain amino acid transport system substrate-binding protein
MGLQAVCKSRRNVLAAAALGAAVAVAVAACGSSGGGSAGPAATSGPTSARPTKTITIGLLTDVTGPAASGNKTSVEGVKAGVAYASHNGYTIKYVVADTATSPTVALAAAQKLVTQQHVVAVVADSALTFAAASYLTAHNIPVVGAPQDAAEWITATNMFGVFGALHTTKVASTLGQFFKNQGVTTVASIGYSISPVSAEFAKATAASATAAGLKVGYLNAQFPFGSTNVAPIALAMKKAGADGFFASVDPNTSFALIAALRQNGVKLKSALLPTGYGGDVLQAGPGALSDAQNVYFSLAFQPIEMQTAATRQFVADLRASGTTTEPTYAMYVGYESVGLLVRAFDAAGATPTSASILTALGGIHDFDGLGLLGNRTVDINDRDSIISGPGNCTWVTKLVGSRFQLVPGSTPLCGRDLGLTVAPSS